LTIVRNSFTRALFFRQSRPPGEDALGFIFLTFQVAGAQRLYAYVSVSYIHAASDQATQVPKVRQGVVSPQSREAEDLPNL
jgi:hypothetical protein